MTLNAAIIIALEPAKPDCFGMLEIKFRLNLFCTLKCFEKTSLVNFKMGISLTEEDFSFK